MFKINYYFMLKISAYQYLWTDFYIKWCFGGAIPSYVAKEKKKKKQLTTEIHTVKARVYMGINARNLSSGVCEQRRRPACAFPRRLIRAFIIRFFESII